MATDYDAIIVGSGPNGLAAGIRLKQEGLNVLIIEGSDQLGGGMRSKELTLPGYLHDVCSAIHPMAAGSPYFQSLPLEKYGLNYIHPKILAAHPFDDRPSAILLNSIDDTASRFGIDREAYLNFFGPQIQKWPTIVNDVLGPLKKPKSIRDMLKFGTTALKSAITNSKKFKTPELKGLWAGMTAHSMLPLDKLTTSAIGLVLVINGHLNGWPIPKGGSQALANSLVNLFLDLGGRIERGWYVRNTAELPTSRAIIFDVSPKQLLEIAGNKFSSIYRWQLNHFRYGVGVFKVDWALSEQIPFKDKKTREAGTVHLGNTIEEIQKSESDCNRGIHNKNPFVLLAQQSVFDTSRAPKDRHTAYAYCHVPNGSTVDMTSIIENQVERFAPGFKDTILKRHTFNTLQFQDYNPNYIGGDINGGSLDFCQLYTRPTLRLPPYRTSARNIYICSASTPPGGGVHGMCGLHAAETVIKDHFR